ncbi:MAG: glycine cleavage system aminomethyltransferase GcvT [Candidatus Marinimicrobia bacterium]|nr:glycine cleavage system aminomethyltransferase GcvT [Candidatus Neomarinimicrobiota bacterium]
MNNHELKISPIHKRHLALDAKMVSFAGYSMPIQYEGIVSEHESVRNTAGLFDVSHMGEISISGSEAESFLNKLTINDVSNLEIGQAQYTAMCNENGGIIDDVILYKYNNYYLMVTNAANHEKDLEWLKLHQYKNVHIRDISQSLGLIAIQGPKSREILQQCTFADLNQISFYHFIEAEISGASGTISRTGYTGELGFELYFDSDSIGTIWDNIMNVGSSMGLKPVGLGARDTLRMEMKYCLYGNDINENTNPFEAGLGWITKMNKNSSFIGQPALIEIKPKLSRRFVSFEMTERAIPRTENIIYCNDEQIGIVTSGTQSPSLKKGIGLGYIDKPFDKKGQVIEIDIRGKRKEAIIVKPPFYKNGSNLN